MEQNETLLNSKVDKTPSEIGEITNGMYFSLRELSKATGFALGWLHNEARSGHVQIDRSNPTTGGRYQACVTPAQISAWLDYRANRPEIRPLTLDSVFERLAEITGIPQSSIWDALTPKHPSPAVETRSDRDRFISAMLEPEPANFWTTGTVQWLLAP